jgi:AcrR family transcriptional regulator
MPRLSTEERKEQIINEAIRIIHEEGYGALSIRVLSKRVGITEPAIYRHFLNKDDIIKGILDRIYHFGNHLFERAKNKETFSEKLKMFIVSHFEFFEDKPEMTSVVFSEDLFLHNKELESKLGELMKQRKRMLKKIFDEANQEGYEIKGDPEDISLIILGIVRITVLEWKLSGFQYSLKERGMKLLKTIEDMGMLETKEISGN